MEDWKSKVAAQLQWVHKKDGGARPTRVPLMSIAGRSANDKHTNLVLASPEPASSEPERPVGARRKKHDNIEVDAKSESRLLHGEAVSESRQAAIENNAKPECGLSD